MSSLEDSQVYLHDDKISDFADKISRLHGLSIRIETMSGEIVVERGEGAGGPAEHEHALSIWGTTVGNVRVWAAAGRDAEAEEVARVIALYAENVVDSEYQMGSLAEEISEKYEEVNLLYDLNDELTALFDEERIGRRLLRRLDSILTVDCGTVLILDGDRFKPLAMKNKDGFPCLAGTGIGDGLPVDRGVLGDLARRRKSILVSDQASLDEEVRRTEQFLPTDALLVVPLLHSPESDDETLLGAIVLTAKESGRPFTTGDQKLVSAVASQAASAIHNARLVEELKAAARMKRDLELAREIQVSLLPNEAPVADGIEVAGRCVTADNVGGDYYGYVPRGTEALTVLLGDVTGHDLGAALIMSTARATLLATASNSDNPAEIVRRSNRLLYRDLSSSNLLISLFVAHFDSATRRLAFANGGHNPPVYLPASSDRTEPLDAEGLILGVEEEFDYELGIREVRQGDVIVLYTDGIVEARSPEGDEFGEEKMNKAILESRDRSAEAIADHLFEQVRGFTRGTRIRDDITVVVLKVTE